MSVFGRMDDFGNDPAKPFLTNLNVELGRLFELFSKAKGAINLIGTVLITIENTLTRLSNAAKSATNALRLNPLASGLLKIAVQVIVVFLKAAEGALAIASGIVATIRQAFFRTVRKRIIDLVDAINARVLEIIRIDGEIQGIISFIQKVARFLKIQEDAGHYPAQKLQEFEREFDALFYQVVPPIKAQIARVVSELDPIQQTVERIRSEIDAIDAALSPFAAIVATFNATIGLVLRKISDVATAVKQWIDDKVAWLGWLLDGIEWVIDEAMKLFGIDRLMDWVKQQLGNVPFVKEAKQYAQRLEQLHKQMEAALNDLQSKAIAIGQDIYLDMRHSMQGHTNETFVYIVTLGIKKSILEWVLPRKIQDLIERLIGAIGTLKALAKQEQEQVQADAKPALPTPLIEEMDGITHEIESLRAMALSIKDADLRMDALTNLLQWTQEHDAQLTGLTRYQGPDRDSSPQLVAQLEERLQLMQQMAPHANAIRETVASMGDTLVDTFVEPLKALDDDYLSLIPDQKGLREVLAL